MRSKINDAARIDLMLEAINNIEVFMAGKRGWFPDGLGLEWFPSGGRGRFPDGRGWEWVSSGGGGRDLPA